MKSKKKYSSLWTRIKWSFIATQLLCLDRVFLKSCNRHAEECQDPDSLPQVHSSQDTDILTRGKLIKQILRRRIFTMSQDPVYFKMFWKVRVYLNNELIGIIALKMFVNSELKWERFRSFDHGVCIFQPKYRNTTINHSDFQVD